MAHLDPIPAGAVRPRQQIADDLLSARDASAAALGAARAATEALVTAITRRRLAEDAFDAAKADMLAAHDGEAAARSAFDLAVVRAVDAALHIEAIAAEAARHRRAA